VPLQMLESSSQGPLAQIGPLYRSKLTWIGFAIPAVFLSIQGLSYYFPSVPTVGLGSGLYLFDGLLAIRGIVFAWVGFSYLVNLDVSMSIWVFYVLSQLQSGALSALGSAPTERLSSYEVSADLAHQGMGACIVFVLYGLWVARHHLADVVRKAWCPQEGVDDSEELISYRTAVVGFMVSLSIMGAWLWQSGIPLFVVPLLLGISLLLYIMITRVIVTAGVASARAPLIAAFVLISGMGSSAIGATGLTALGFTYIWQAEMRLFPMIACANSLKLAETVRGPKKRLLWAIVIALGASFVGAIYVCLYISYTHGGINLDTLYYGHAQRPFTDLIYYFKNLTGPDWRGWGFTGIGAGIESLLIYAQHHFHWWRLHPLGFVIGSGWLASSIWFSVFVAWFLKFMIMKYGGMPRFITAKPFFIGLILGEVATSGIWLIVDALLSQSGHRLSRM
jgi:hypothetical protein